MKKELPENIEKILKGLPKTPGVYQMKDKDGKVIYVGKAKSLKSRVNSYFDRTGDLTLAKKQMVGKIADIETILCQTEVEALVLETNLIKHLTPKYNILMKDDKNLSYIKITNSPVPELIKTRRKIHDGAEYYGPFVSGVDQCARALRRIARIRNCRMKFEQRGQNIIITDRAGKTPPCMDYYIGLCPAPCLLELSKIGEHDDHIDQARRYLKGEVKDMIEGLEEDMREKARNLQFEEAQDIKETIESLRSMHERQSVRDIVEGDVDVFLMYEKYDKSYIVLTQVRASKIIGVFRQEVTPGIDTDIAVQFLTRQYLEHDDYPQILLLRDSIGDEAFIEFLRERKIVIEYPQIGGKKSLLDFSMNQIREYAYKREMQSLENRTLTREHMVNILTELGYAVPEKGEIVFECYDISHTDGHFTYASRVVIVNGKPDPSRYKKYKIKTLQDGDIDDFASHREVMMRRTLEGLELQNFPHLIIIDGGKGQLSSAMLGIKEGIWKHENAISSNPSLRIKGSETEGNVAIQKIQEDQFLLTGLLPTPGGSLSSLHSDSPFSSQGQIKICSIAKREEEVFLPNQKSPVLFEKGTPELMVIQKARDESHRFSINANKTERMKSMKKNILEEIPGIGPVTRKKLLKLAGSVDEIKNIDIAEIEKICTNSQIQSLRDHGVF